MGKKQESAGRPVAFCAMMAALGTVIMLTGGLVPVFTYCSPLIASFMLIAVMDEYGNAKGWMVWGVTAMLSLLIGVDKEASFFYVFLGWYPMIEPYIGRISSRLIRTLANTALFTVLICAMYGVVCFVLGLDEITETFTAVVWVNAAFIAMLVFAMLLFARTVPNFRIIYKKKIRERIKRF